MEIKAIVQVYKVTYDDQTQSPILIIDYGDKEKLIPVWIGITEAQAILVAMHDIKIPRPNTHDLLNTIMNELNGELIKVIINGLHERTFYATLIIRHGNARKTIDTRPSDAVALALRADAPIYITDTLIRQYEATNRLMAKTELEEWLKNLPDKDLPKHKM